MHGILGALSEEVDALIEALATPKVVMTAGVEVHHGFLEGRPVVVARSGVGKVNGALAAAALLAAGAESILFTGVAGAVAPGLKVGDIVVATDLVQHDVDMTAVGFPPGKLLDEPSCWPVDSAMRARLLAAARAQAGPGVTVVESRIASGDQFVASAEQIGRIRSQFGAVATEMEGAAVAQVCRKADVPCAVLRVISDTADHDAPADFPAFLKQAAALGIAVTRRMIAGSLH